MAFYSIFIFASLICLGDVVVRGQMTTLGSAMGMAFMNITTEVDETGFYQMYCVSDRSTLVRLETISQINQFATVSSTTAFFNGTYSFLGLDLVAEYDPDKLPYVDELGVLMTANNVINCFGVKSDRGTTDGFMALPITKQSTEFYIATWECQLKEFFSGVQVVSLFQDTCFSVYCYNENGTADIMTEAYFTKANQVYMYTTNCRSESDRKDLTGCFVNSTKPISVFAGNSCAFIPTNNTNFCDYIAEQMFPTTETGTQFIVLPILGRSSGAGYIVRVVPTQPGTIVTWKTDDGSTAGGSVTLIMGEFKQIDAQSASGTLEITCSLPCVVMQYNKGTAAAPAGVTDTPTDPMMMNIAADNHFDNHSCFATANFDADINWTVDFANFVSIVTKGSKDDILFNGQAIDNIYWKFTRSGYWYAVFPITHGAHCIRVKPGSNTLFGAYVYGHSMLDWSTSAYGFTAAFRILGDHVTELWEDSAAQLQKENKQSLNATCVQERVFSGSAVATYPQASFPQTVVYTIALDATVSTDPMKSSCREKYKQELISNVVDMSRLINFLICNKTLCPYISGSIGSGIPVNASASTSDQVLFVAIDARDLSKSVVLDTTAEGAITTVHVYLPYTGIMDTTSDTFSQCATDIRNFLVPFMNWPLSNRLLPSIPNCPPFTTLAPFKFVLASSCPA